MKGFNFEKNLLHQERAVESTLAVFENLEVYPVSEIDRNFVNPVYNNIEKRANNFDNQMKPFGQYANNIKARQEQNSISEKIKANSNIIDIMMETGTGKTYTYTKTIFELNKQYGIFKFIVVVPTLSIKAGTINFLKSDSSREHFKEQYGKTLCLHVVESQKNSKNKKAYIPPAVISFVNAGLYEKNSIQVMIINAGMINSETMQKSFDKRLFDKYAIPQEAIEATKPFMIIDEPHKFGIGNKTWENIQKMRPQFILRYGATFPDLEIKTKNALSGKMEVSTVKDYHNLIYRLSAVDAFNNNLVKGIIGHTTVFEKGENTSVKFIDSDGTEATFELIEGNTRKKITLAKKESLSIIHAEMTSLTIENLTKSMVALSNGLDMRKGDTINPYSYAEKLQETMIQKAIVQHFKNEKALLSRDVKIKPLTLFFIDNIDEYRNKDGYLRNTVEQCIKTEVENLLKTEEDVFYKAYLEKTLIDLSATHGGYFSKDNSDKDDAIEKEINEILHDKQALLDLDNPRRFIFSKWTLREGWDNPNVFLICKLRSSGSEISKLQEVGRGLRLPVNEYGNRVKDEQFYLDYFVDFTESEFMNKLVEEINQNSGAISIEEVPTKLHEGMIKQIIQKYNITEEQLLEQLDEAGAVKRNNDFKEGGFEYIKQSFPLIFEGVNSTKIRKATDIKKKITVRTEKYDELKALWEKLNEKVILEYKFDNEALFKKLFADFIKAEQNSFTEEGMRERVSKIDIIDDKAVANEPESVYNQKIVSISTMKYSDFLKELSKRLSFNLKTLHDAIVESKIEINQFLSQKTIRIIEDKFNYFLMAKAFDKFSIEYKNVSNSIHPTKLTDEKGNVREEISASDVGVLFSDDAVAKSYFFEELYYDSELEKLNIKAEIDEVIVFTKIPKSSIRIPVAGGRSYSPDFAYVVKLKDGEQKLHLIVETKDTAGSDVLRDEEKFKIKHAEKFFEGKVKIEFRTQFSNNKMVELIGKIVAA